MVGWAGSSTWKPTDSTLHVFQHNRGLALTAIAPVERLNGMFIDSARLEVRAGDGGNGCSSFRREKFVPLGGPAGGDGGRGGSVILVAHDRFSTLFDLRYRKVVRAERGEDGRGKDQFGKAGEDIRIQVPVGTQVYDQQSDALLADLSETGLQTAAEAAAAAARSAGSGVIVASRTVNPYSVGISRSTRMRAWSAAGKV